nr:MAG TPA_asm: hypothetical protein [Bacteriophage sp.]DAY20898.1 MAG TPA: hypothetical protein [Bacteriophage sp.]
MCGRSSLSRSNKSAAPRCARLEGGKGNICLFTFYND